VAFVSNNNTNKRKTEHPTEHPRHLSGEENKFLNEGLRQSVRKDQPALRIGIIDFHSFAAHACQDISGLGGVAGGHVLSTR
jgi:hypothetical protein